MAKLYRAKLITRDRVERRRPARTGALLSFELLFVLPLFVGLVFAVAEFGLLWSANNQIKLASQRGCRVGTLPANDPAILQAAVEAVVIEALGTSRLVNGHILKFTPGGHTGDPVVCEIRLPMDAAAPDLLGALGFRLAGRELIARTVMRKE